MEGKQTACRVQIQRLQQVVEKQEKMKTLVPSSALPGAKGTACGAEGVECEKEGEQTEQETCLVSL